MLASPDVALPLPLPQMLGLNNVPQAGDEFTVFETEADARVAGACVGRFDVLAKQDPACLPVCVPRPSACLFACRARLLACLLAAPLCLPVCLPRPSACPLCYG